MEIWHNTRCSKSREACSILQTGGNKAEIFEYLKEPLTEAMIESLLFKLNMKPEEILRKKEAVYIENFKDKKFSTKQWLKILVEHPILIERPIVVKGDRAIIARPIEKMNEFLDL
ncbi:MAG: arsenate reductase (glutaredoxin) [Bacteroidetes bacterium]|nr:arsenate reductase (glutaredoxin) [Bacteroidota bacterium]